MSAVLDSALYVKVLADLGDVRIDAEQVLITGFSGVNCSCRDVAILAMTWAIGRLQRELAETLERPGGGSVVID